MSRPPVLAPNAAGGGDCILAACTPALAESYRVFVIRASGAGAYQASVEYIQWLHYEQALSRGVGKDFTVLLNPQGVAVSPRMMTRTRIMGLGGRRQK